MNPDRSEQTSVDSQKIPLAPGKERREEGGRGERVIVGLKRLSEVGWTLKHEEIQREM